MIEHKTETARSGQKENREIRTGKVARNKQQGEAEQQAGAQEHPPDKHRLVAAALDQQVPQGMHQGGKEDQEKSGIAHDTPFCSDNGEWSPVRRPPGRGVKLLTNDG